MKHFMKAHINKYIFILKDKHFNGLQNLCFAKENAPFYFSMYSKKRPFLVMGVFFFALREQ